MDWSYFVLALLFIVVVVPTWMRHHYRSRLMTERSLSEAELRELKTLRDRAQRLEGRIATLERVLDAEHPQWRERL